MMIHRLSFLHHRFLFTISEEKYYLIYFGLYFLRKTAYTNDGDRQRRVSIKASKHTLGA